LINNKLSIKLMNINIVCNQNY